MAKTKQRQEGAKVEEVKKAKICRQLVSSVTTKLLQRERERERARGRQMIDRSIVCLHNWKKRVWAGASDRLRECGGKEKGKRGKLMLPLLLLAKRR